MNRAQIEAKERGLSSLAKKVLEATPIANPWEMNKIIEELHRNGCTAEYRAVQGCLAYLRDEHLVKEVGKSVYQRVAKREKPEKLPAEDHQEMPMKLVLPEKSAQTDEDPIKSLGDLAAALRSHSDSMKEIASRIDNLALDLQVALEKNIDAANRLRALQSLLKDS